MPVACTHVIDVAIAKALSVTALIDRFCVLSVQLATVQKLRLRRTLVGFMVGCGLTVATSCNPQQADGPKQQPTETAQTRYDRILEAMRERLEDTDGSSRDRFTFRDSSGAGTAAFAFRVEPSTTIIAEPARGESAQATITVTLETSYSALPSEKKEAEAAEEEQQRDERDERRAANMDAYGVTEDGVEILDSDLLVDAPTGTANGRAMTPDISTRTITGKNVTKYELIYDRDLWRLASPPKADAPESANAAMERALKRQG